VRSWQQYSRERSSLSRTRRASSRIGSERNASIGGWWLNRKLHFDDRALTQIAGPATLHLARGVHMRSTGSIVRILPAAMLFTFACSSSNNNSGGVGGSSGGGATTLGGTAGGWRHAIEHRWNRFRRLDGNSDRRSSRRHVGWWRRVIGHRWSRFWRFDGNSDRWNSRRHTGQRRQVIGHRWSRIRRYDGTSDR